MIETFGPGHMPRSKPTPQVPAARPLRIAVVSFDRISPFHLAAPCVVFGERHPGAPPCDLRVCSAEGPALRTTGGFSLVTHHGLASLRWADLV
jgi:transcriptional regulator GlxA family with amidase domain